MCLYLNNVNSPVRDTSTGTCLDEWDLVCKSHAQILMFQKSVCTLDTKVYKIGFKALA